MTAPTLDRKRAVVPVDQIGEWLHLFMTYAATERYPEEGSQLMTYMDHILTMHAQKGPRCGWNMTIVSVLGGRRRILLGISLTTPSTPALRQSVTQKQQTHLSRPSPFVNMLPEAPDDALPVSVLSLTRENVKGQIADTYMDVSSAKRRAKASLQRNPLQSPPQKKTG